MLTIAYPEQVWLFHGDNANFTSAVFLDEEAAVAWIAENKMSGMLSAYPVNQSIFEWAVDKGYFTPSKPWHDTADYQANFTSASQVHHHFKNGQKA